MPPIGLLPVETLVNVFGLCSYMDLLSISCVCRVWKTVVESDPSLRVQTFKSIGDDIEDPNSLLRSASTASLLTGIQIHPVVMRVSYRMGDELFAAGLPCEDSDNAKTRRIRPLPEFAVSTDFATIPAIKSINIEVKRPSCTCCQPTVLSFMVSVQNATGVRVLDIFSAMAREARTQCDLVHLASRGAFSQRLQPGQKKSTTIKADMLGRHRNYAGLFEATRDAFGPTFKSHTAI